MLTAQINIAAPSEVCGQCCAAVSPSCHPVPCPEPTRSDSARERALSSAVSHHGFDCKCTAEAKVPAVLARCDTTACQAECPDICFASTAILHASEPASRFTYRRRG